MSQLVARLQDRIRNETDPMILAELEARLAWNEARLGHFEVARQRILRLREAHAGVRASVATLWIMLAEGILLYYEEVDHRSALDRVGRAEALARVMGCAPLAGMCAAWKAHFQFQEGDFEAMAQSLKLAEREVSEHDIEARTRIAVVVCSALLMCDRISAAPAWFLRARDLAVRCGDRASIDALQYNRASILLARARLANCRNAVTLDELNTLQSEVQTSSNLQRLAQISTMSNHIELWSARLHILKGDWHAAIEALALVRTKAPFAKHNFSQSLIDLEICYCLCSAGDARAATEHFDKCSLAALAELDSDEQIVAEWMKWKLSQMDDYFGDPALHQATLETLLEREAAQTRQLELALAPFLTPEEHGT